jgi:outer membrane protein assembly factor BamA
MAAAAALCATQPALASTQAPVVRAISIDGNAIVPSGTILKLVATELGKPYDRRHLDRDIQRIDGYYDGHGFGGQLPTHVIATKFDALSGELDLSIREGLIVRDVVVSVDPVLPRALVLEALNTRSDDVYSQDLRQSDVDSVRDLFERHDLQLGSFAGGVDVRSVDPARGTADVRYTISAARIGAIAIDGNARMRDAYIRHTLGLRLGDLITDASMERALRRLKRTGKFSSIDVSTHPGPDPDAPARLTLVWRVKERKG